MTSHAATDVEELNIEELLNVLWCGKRFILVIVVLAVMTAGAVSLMFDDEYQSSALLAPNQSGEDLAGGLLSQFGGLASLAGINLGGGKTDPATIAIETIQSQVFLARFIKKHDLKVSLFATAGWDVEKRSWKIDPSAYDEKTGVWLRSVKPPRVPEPSDTEAVEEFRKKFSVKQDKKSGLVTITLVSRSPEMAKTWLDWIVEDINAYLRENDAAEARESIEYLKRQLEQTSVAEMQKVFYQLIEQQTKAAMLAEVRQQYAFRVIDGPVVPEEKYGPKRIVMVLVSGLLAGALACLIVLVRARFKKAKQAE